MNKAELSYEQFLGTQEPCPALTPAATQLKLCEEKKKKKNPYIVEKDYMEIMLQSNKWKSFPSGCWEVLGSLKIEGLWPGSFSVAVMIKRR